MEVSTFAGLKGLTHTREEDDPKRLECRIREGDNPVGEVGGWR